MTKTITCDICFESEDIDEYDVNDKTRKQYYICPPDWMYSPNGKIDLIPGKHDENINRSVQVTHICFDCIKEAMYDLIKKRNQK